jgi:hypothetical protein
MTQILSTSHWHKLLFATVAVSLLYTRTLHTYKYIFLWSNKLLGLQPQRDKFNWLPTLEEERRRKSLEGSRNAIFGKHFSITMKSKHI